MTSRVSTTAFWMILAVALLVRLVLVIAVPFGPTVAWHLKGLNDEPAHFNYVRYLADHRALPVQTHHSMEPGAIERGDFEYYQPPLYYVLCASLVAAAGEGVGFTLCRLLSFACGVLSLLVMGRVLGRLGAPEISRRLGVLFLALLPAHAYFTSLVSNDSLSWLLALLLTDRLLALCDQARAGAVRTGTHLAVGILLAAGLLAKTSVALLVPAVLFAYAIAFRWARDHQLWRGALMGAGLCILLAGPWYLRNYWLYGAAFALHMGFGPPRDQGGTLAGLTHVVKATARYFWFPMQDVQQALPVSILRRMGAVLVLAHGIAAIAYLRQKGEHDVKRVMVILVLGLALIAQVGLDLLWISAEGRFLFPALPAIVFLFVAPVVALFERWKAHPSLAWAYLCLLALHPWLFLPFV